jgi:hypothetical protein
MDGEPINYAVIIYLFRSKLETTVISAKKKRRPHHDYVDHSRFLADQSPLAIDTRVS